MLMDRGCGMSRNAARRLIEERMNVQWIETGTGRKGNPLMLRRLESAARIDGINSGTESASFDTTIPAPCPR